MGCTIEQTAEARFCYVVFKSRLIAMNSWQDSIAMLPGIYQGLNVVDHVISGCDVQRSTGLISYRG